MRDFSDKTQKHLPPLLRELKGSSLELIELRKLLDNS